MATETSSICCNPVSNNLLSNSSAGNCNSMVLVSAMNNTSSMITSSPESSPTSNHHMGANNNIRSNCCSDGAAAAAVTLAGTVTMHSAGPAVTSEPALGGGYFSCNNNMGITDKKAPSLQQAAATATQGASEHGKFNQSQIQWPVISNNNTNWRGTLLALDLISKPKFRI